MERRVHREPNLSKYSQHSYSSTGLIYNAFLNTSYLPFVSANFIKLIGEYKTEKKIYAHDSLLQPIGNEDLN
jgi:hypothetical protein